MPVSYQIERKSSRIVRYVSGNHLDRRLVLPFLDSPWPDVIVIILLTGVHFSFWSSLPLLLGNRGIDSSRTLEYWLWGMGLS